MPEEFVPSTPADGQRIVIPSDRVIPGGPARLDLRKVRQPINRVASIESVQATWRADEPTEEMKLDLARDRAMHDLDTEYAAHFAVVRGPLAVVHSEKRRQAEAGSGALIADEDDRVAILAAAAAEDIILAEIEGARRAKKAALRAATSMEELNSIMAATDVADKKGSKL